MSKERARRRAEREAIAAVAAVKRERSDARRARWRALLRRLTPRQRRRAWLLGRRHPAQRSAIIGALLGSLFLIWYLIGSLPLRIAFSLLLVLLLPVLITVAFNRKV